ncbi:MAG: cupin domain-containing protein [Firmicutes bacterium]|nr:cupin domain-containing protein [Bacillota bacterium]
MHADIPAEDMPTWTKRRIAAHGEDLMLVENEFMTGDTAPEHEHFHAQITYVIKGALEFTVDGETKTLRSGDSVYIRPHTVHSAVAVEDSLIIDLFAPQREDFLD